MGCELQLLASITLIEVVELPMLIVSTTTTTTKTKGFFGGTLFLNVERLGFCGSDLFAI